MEIEFLGTGTSTGIPQIGCNCEVCTSTAQHDKRLRTSAMVHTDNGLNLLIDCGPDFRTQILRAKYNNPCALLVTHSHYDHVGGIDDLRPYCFHRKFPIYAVKMYCTTFVCACHTVSSHTLTPGFRHST